MRKTEWLKKYCFSKFNLCLIKWANSYPDTRNCSFLDANDLVVTPPNYETLMPVTYLRLKAHYSGLFFFDIKCLSQYSILFLGSRKFLLSNNMNRHFSYSVLYSLKTDQICFIKFPSNRSAKIFFFKKLVSYFIVIHFMNYRLYRL